MKTYTPLRYPGGKSKIYNKVLSIINQGFSKKPVYVEVFAGGAGLALKLLLNDKVDSIHINDFDNAIYSFWYSVLNHSEELCFLVENTEVSLEEWKKQKLIYLNQKKHTLLEVGFSTLYLNRANRSGVLLAGPIGGMSQKGKYKIDCRFNKKSITQLIKTIHGFRDKIYLYNQDGKEFVSKIDKISDNLLIYLDPPYVKQGPKLYMNHFKVDDHIKLRDTLSILKNKWFLTYDCTELIKDAYSEFNQEIYDINYSMSVKRKEKEVFILSKTLSMI